MQCRAPSMEGDTEGNTPQTRSRTLRAHDHRYPTHLRGRAPNTHPLSRLRLPSGALANICPYSICVEMDLRQISRIFRGCVLAGITGVSIRIE